MVIGAARTASLSRWGRIAHNIGSEICPWQSIRPVDGTKVLHPNREYEISVKNFRRRQFRHGCNANGRATGFIQGATHSFGYAQWEVLQLDDTCWPGPVFQWTEFDSIRRGQWDFLCGHRRLGRRRHSESLVRTEVWRMYEDAGAMRKRISDR